MLDKKIGDTFDIKLDNRGTSGLSMKYTMDNQGIVSVEGPHFMKTENRMPGDPARVSFTIRTIKTGTVKILFYETQVRNKSFPPLEVLTLLVNVSA